MTTEAHERARAAYASHARPGLYTRLAALGLDIVYERGEGAYLVGHTSEGRALTVLDMVGGYGACLFGHDAPSVREAARGHLAPGRPYLVQGSVRPNAALLCERLSERVGRATGRSYVVTLASTGAEAVEAALKHAFFERHERERAEADAHARTVRKLRGLLARGELVRGAAFEAQVERLLGRTEPDLEAIIREVEARRTQSAERRVVLLTLERGFHGKLTGALSLTANDKYKRKGYAIDAKVRTLAPHDVAAFERVLREHQYSVPELVLEGNELILRERAASDVVALFLEPIQGEGGVHEVPLAMLERAREAADAQGFPLVFDEIQSGMGRTGTFLASEPTGVRADYYTLSKSLGAGIAKVAALLVDADRYVSEFGEVHTSTFAEDELSSAVALAALDLLDADDGALLRTIAERGAYLRERLLSLAGSFPDLVVAVRGRGLMAGIELAKLTHTSSAFLRVVSEQDLLGFVVASYLLHVHGIRALPTLSAANTLRVQPPALITTQEIDRFCEALRQAFILMRMGDARSLVGHLMGMGPRATKLPLPRKAREARKKGAPRVAFLAHFPEPRHLREWDPSFADCDDAACARLLERTSGLLEPFVSERAVVRSANGAEVELIVIGLAFTAEQVMDAFKRGDADRYRELVREAFELARKEGATIVGCGGYTSIVSDNCRDLIDDELLVTSGNSVTAAAAVQAALAAATRLGLNELRVGVVGALGNLGSVLAELLAPHASSIVLAGRRGGKKRLLPRAQELEKAIVEAGCSAVVEVADDLTALTRCNLIVSATNAPRAIIEPRHVADGPVVLVDVAVPGDVAEDVARERPKALVLGGGVAQLPLGQRLSFGGMDLPSGEVYGCLAETLLLGLDRASRSLSVGALTVAGVREASELAARHGFTLGESTAPSHHEPSNPENTPMPFAFLGDAQLDPVRAGHKAAQLHRLAVAGHPVPPGFVVAHDVSLDALSRDALSAAVERIGGFPVAVRSSGVLEDLAGASFAGQYESYLNVGSLDELYDRIRDCRGSAHNERVVAYLKRQGYDEDKAAVSVLVQRMVNARVAGVAFSLDPMTGKEEHALVELCEGLGEKLVSGHVRPSRYRLLLRTGEVVEENLGDEGAKLTEREAKALVRELLAAMALAGRPQDVEFAIDQGGALFVLQSRPITTVRFRDDVEQMTNADFKDGGISARVCTPLMFSLYRNAMQVSMPAYLKRIRLIDDGSEETWIASYYGRGYWNAAAVKRALHKVPGFDERRFDRDLGIQKDYGPNGPTVIPTNARTVARAIPIALALEAGYKEALALVEEFRPRFASEYQRFKERIAAFTSTPDEAFDKDLLDVLLRFHAWAERAYFTVIYNNSNAQSDFKGVVEKIDAATGRSTSLTALMAGLDGVHHMDMQRGMVRLYDVAREHGLESALFAEELTRFLDAYGFHSDAVLDITVPRWSEAKERVIEHVSAMLRAGTRPVSPDEAAKKQRETYEAELWAVRKAIRERFTLRVRFAGSFEKNLSRMRAFLSAREAMREYSTKTYAIVRAYVVEAATRFVRRGLLSRPDDIFMLSIEEVRDLVEGRLSISDTQARVEFARAMYEGYRDFPAPNEFGRGVSQRSASSQVTEVDGRRALVGLGCSPGVVEGTVRVIGSLDEIGRLKAGDVLVTRFTDPGWTPALGIVSAVITEVGGLLSHAAVIGREYGIPAVLDLSGATTALRSGQRVRVDGSTGLVVVLDENCEPEEASFSCTETLVQGAEA